MFVGHYAVAFAAKKFHPSVGLVFLFIAVQLVDLIWPIFLLLGIEHVRIDPGNTTFTPLDFYDYPYTHSLVFTLVWSVLLGVAYWLWKRDVRGMALIGVCVASHWILDFITHRPDLPLAPGSSVLFGLGLWDNRLATIAVELALFVIGIWFYLKSTAPKNGTGTWALWGLIAFFIVIWVGNIFGPPPPSVETITIAGNAMWLFVLWAWWVDRNRKGLVTALRSQ
jgi:hypothetical protein